MAPCARRVLAEVTLRCLLFDLDEVLVDYDRSVRVSHLAHAIGCASEAVQEAIYGSGIEDAADSGMLTAASYLDALSAHLARTVTVDAWTAARRAATQVRGDVLGLATALATRVTVAILTNNGVLMAEQLPRIVPALFPLFEGRAFASAQFSARKPQAQVYTRCLDRLGVPANATLFVDDNRDNVDGAREAGLVAHHYRDLTGLKTALANFSLI
ncbi:MULTISPECIES: HAD-IA family hydrolase [unclassified Dyella]|uniref:HAD-IA family hydrolase n=1 Tax=unclassified Dyella TaxID=2634549 RepID=UPI000CA86339|nr:MULTISPECIES: HAD-IA family hydrolase [unclassified Dyella]MDR3446411.1 HAD-IA family hydrolase [Dyella sp.]PMQ07495.1 Alpha-D-glucose-1-phosphate phosphatase YihX [Dyella sp. AD56]